MATLVSTSSGQSPSESSVRHSTYNFPNCQKLDFLILRPNNQKFDTQDTRYWELQKREEEDRTKNQHENIFSQQLLVWTCFSEIASSERILWFSFSHPLSTESQFLALNSESSSCRLRSAVVRMVAGSSGRADGCGERMVKAQGQSPSTAC